MRRCPRRIETWKRYDPAPWIPRPWFEEMKRRRVFRALIGYGMTRWRGVRADGSFLGFHGSELDRVEHGHVLPPRLGNRQRHLLYCTYIASITRCIDAYRQVTLAN